jgi:hypothetical protein
MERKLIYLLILYSGAIFAQPEFAPIGAEWTYESFYGQWHPPFNKYYGLYKAEYSKDSLIDNKSYKKIIRRTIQSVPGNPEQQEMWIRQDGERIFIRFDKDYILYDFSAKEGDTIRSTGLDPLSKNIKSIDIVVRDIYFDTIDGEIYKVQKNYFACFADQATRLIHQKFGCMSDVDLFFPENLCIFDYWFWVKPRCYKDSNSPEINFDSIPCDSIRPNIIETITNQFIASTIAVYPTLFSDHLQIESRSNPIQKIVIFSLNGMEVHSDFFTVPLYHSELHLNQLHQGVYFLKVFQDDGRITLMKIIKE